MAVRRSLLILAAAAAAGLGVGASTAAGTKRPLPRVSTLRLLQFNVLSATQGRDAGVAAVIKGSGADVVTLDEVAYKDIFDKIAQETGLHSVWVRSRDVFSVGILSRYPIRDCTPYVDPPMHHAAYSCRIRVGMTDWWIFGAHLYPGTEAQRAEEISFLLSRMEAHPRGRVVLAGDLNSQTPGENDETPLLVVPMIRAAGYVDSYREVYPNPQEAPGFTITPPPWGSWERRLDYVFHSRTIRAVAARVISSVPGYTWPSDHAALYVKLVSRVRLVSSAQSTRPR